MTVKDSRDFQYYSPIYLVIIRQNAYVQSLFVIFDKNNAFVIIIRVPNLKYLKFFKIEFFSVHEIFQKNYGKFFHFFHISVFDYEESKINIDFQALDLKAKASLLK